MCWVVEDLKAPLMDAVSAGDNQFVGGTVISAEDKKEGVSIM